ncbi:MAG: monovalent cation/H+ antiporter subunit D family protein, partial [Planctomycetota bacterium]
MPETLPDIRLLLSVLVPLAGALLVMAAGRRPNLREACSFVAALGLFGLTISMLPAVLAGKTLSFTVLTLLPGLSVSLRADALSMIFALPASFLWVLTVFYSAGYMRGLAEHAQTRFSACFALTLFGAAGVAFSDNLLTLYLFYEIESVCTNP